MKVTFFIFAVVVLAFGATCTHSASYALEANGTACIIVNTTFIVRVAYVNTKGETAIASWTLGKSRNTTGWCDYQTPKQGWSELTLQASGVSLGLRFVSGHGGVALSNASLSVVIGNGTRFTNPNVTGPVTLTARPNLPLSADVNHHFLCRSTIKLDLTGPVKGSSVSLTGGAIIQAFNLTGGKLSNLTTECSQDSSTSTSTTASPSTSVTTMKPTATPTGTPSSEAPLLNLTVRDSRTNVTCLRLSARLQLSVHYLRPGRVAGPVAVAIREDATVGGNCGATEQTLRVAFFENWRLSLSLTKTADGKHYGLSAVQLSYNLNNSAMFPGASYPGRLLTALANGSLAISGVPSDGYYACSNVSQTLTDATDEVLARIDLTLRDLSLQAFRTDNGTQQFTGGRTLCPQDAPTPTDNVVPIAVGAALAGLVVIVLVAYLIGRRRQSGGAARAEGYQSV